ncbi:hypothetical protein KJA15_02430 [Patescibacteria group bacterium]|nr:hypothetical protein [Patescibacteria group bacterium]
MQVFEFHFNPKLKEDLIFDSFCYTPENVYEKRLGSLYIVGELRNTLPQNLKLLHSLAQIIKGKYYAFPTLSKDQSFSEGLKKANEFLAEEISKENTSWLGNLSFAVISMKDFNLNFTKVEGLKILLARGGKILDIGDRLEFKEIEPYPLKVFKNIVSGKLAEGDLIIVLTKEVFDLFSKENLINEIAQVPIEEKFYEKKLKKTLKNKEELLSEISGICLLIVLKPEFVPKEIFTFKKETPLFSIWQVLKPVSSGVRNFLKIPKKIFSFKKERVLPPKIGFLEKIKAKPKNLIVSLSSKIKISSNFKKNLILISALIFFLILGFFIFKKEREYRLKEYKVNLNKIQQKIELAKDFLVFKDEKKANSLFREAWEEILPLTEEKTFFKNEALALKESIEKELQNLSKLEKIAEPELLFQFQKGEFFPQKMLLLDKVLYFFNPYYQDLYKFQQGEKIKIETNQKFNLASLLSENSILFFSKPDKLILFQDNQFKESFSLKEPHPDFEFNDFSSFKGNLYFLDGKTGEILKYPFPLVFGKDSPNLWLNPETKKVIDGKSIAIDGSIWILDKRNKIHRYLLGKYQETLDLDFFPYLENLDKIFTRWNLPYLYLLESGQNRIIILEKSGQIFSQFQSEKFDNLKDFTVSENGKKIYLLNGLKVYQVQF